MTAIEAAKLCHDRGYIKRDKMDDRLWKNSNVFYPCAGTLPGDDWMDYDPEGEETSIVG